jgi:hypothetical protein
MVTPRTSLPRASARTTKFFSPWTPTMMKLSGLKVLVAGCRRAVLLSSSNSACSDASAKLKVSI